MIAFTKFFHYNTISSDNISTTDIFLHSTLQHTIKVSF